MNKLALIIYREWITRVRRRAFIIGTLMVPVLLGLGVGLGAWLENAEMEENKDRICTRWPQGQGQ